jgi:hypothetical protein
MATLTRLDGPRAPWNPIAVGEKLSIGRSRENGLMIDDAAVSRRHARIVMREQGYQIVDLGSENGTWVGDRRIQEHWLHTGDLIRIGEARFRFTAEAGEPEAPAAPTPLATSPTVIAGLLAVVVGAAAVILTASVALWYYWPRSATQPAPVAAARPDCYEVCFRRCRAMGDDSSGPWCNDVSCCERACTPMRGVGDSALSFRECEERVKEARR